MVLMSGKEGRVFYLARITMIATLCVAILVLGGARMGLFSGTRPDSLGVNAGKLVACKPTPNCVASQADKSDAEHYIAPIAFSGDATRAWEFLKRAVIGMERVSVVREESDYLYVEQTTWLMGFVDDCEFALDPAGLIQVRSASRLGRKDFGVNRARIEAVRTRFEELSK